MNVVIIVRDLNPDQVVQAEVIRNVSEGQFAAITAILSDQTQTRKVRIVWSMGATVRKTHDPSGELIVVLNEGRVVETDDLWVKSLYEEWVHCIEPEGWLARLYNGQVRAEWID